MNNSYNHSKYQSHKPDFKSIKNKKKRILTYIRLILISLVVQLIISIIFISISFDISLMKRNLYMDYYQREDQNFEDSNIKTFNYIFGFEVDYTSYDTVKFSLITILFTLLLIFSVFYYLRFRFRQTKPNIRNPLIGTLLINVLIILLISLHFTDGILNDAKNYNMLVERYNTHFGYKLYQFLFTEYSDSARLENLVVDLITLIIIIYSFILLIMWFCYQENIISKSEKNLITTS